MGTNSGDGYWEQLDSGCFWGMTYYYNIRRQRIERIYTTKTDDYQRTLHFLRTAYTNPAFFLLWSKRESRHVGIKRWKRINRQREIPFAGLNTSTNARQSSHLIRQPMGDGSMSLIYFSFLISIYFFFSCCFFYSRRNSIFLTESKHSCLLYFTYPSCNSIFESSGCVEIEFLQNWYEERKKILPKTISVK